MVAGFVMLGIVLLILFWAVGAYKRLVSLRNRFKDLFSQIDAQLKRRYDLIPNLVETVKTCMQHERETLEAVVTACNQAASVNAMVAGVPADAATLQQMAAAENTLSTTLGQLVTLAEACPDLRANENMMQLTQELTGTENRIAFSRQAYNDSVMEYNTAIGQFPGSVIARMFSFKPAELMQATDAKEARKAVKLAF